MRDWNMCRRELIIALEVRKQKKMLSIKIKILKKFESTFNPFAKLKRAFITFQSSFKFLVYTQSMNTLIYLSLRAL